MCWIETVQNMVQGEEVYEYRNLLSESMKNLMAERLLCDKNYAPRNYFVNMIHSKVVSPLKTKLNSVALVRERTIPTKRPPLVGEVSANFCG